MKKPDPQYYIVSDNLTKNKGQNLYYLLCKVLFRVHYNYRIKSVAHLLTLMDDENPRFIRISNMVNLISLRDYLASPQEVPESATIMVSGSEAMAALNIVESATADASKYYYKYIDNFFVVPSTEYLHTHNTKWTRFFKTKSHQEIKFFELFCHEWVLQEKGTPRHVEETEVVWVETVEDFDELINFCLSTGQFSFDWETMPREKGLGTKDGRSHATNFERSKPTVLSITPQSGVSYLIPFFHAQSWFNLGSHTTLSKVDAEEETHVLINDSVCADYEDKPFDFQYEKELCPYERMVRVQQYCKQNEIANFLLDIAIPKLNEIFGNPSLKKIGWNFKFDYKICREWGIDVKGNLLTDAMMIIHTLNELTYEYSVDSGKDDDERSGKYKTLKMISACHYPESFGYELKDYFTAEINRLGIYACKDTDFTHRNQLFLEQVLINVPELYRVYRSLENPKLRMLGEMEFKGAHVDCDLLDDLLEESKYKMIEMDSDLRKFPTVINYEVAKAKEVRQAHITTLENKIKQKEFEKLEFLTSKLTDEKVQGKSRANWQKKHFLVLTKNYFHPEYPYVFMVNKAQEIKDIKNGLKKVYAGINFNSSPQVADLLYVHDEGYKYNMPVIRYDIPDPETGGIKYVEGPKATTDKKHLKYLIKDKDGFITAHLEKKSLKTLISTVFTGIKKNIVKDDRIHTNYSTVRTQRLGSSSINLQNIPSRALIESIAKFSTGAKQLFSARDDSEWFFQGDYSQCEIRITAEHSKDPTMVSAYQRGEDIHIITAMNDNDLSQIQWDTLHTTSSKYFEGMSVEQCEKIRKKIQKKLRYNAKASNFSCIYKTSKWGFNDMLLYGYGIDAGVNEAERRMNNFYAKFDSIKAFHNQLINIGRHYGYVTTGFGSRRHLPNINHRDKSVSSSFERIACNSGTQGLGSQYLLFAACVFADRCYMLGIDHIGEITLTVHDSVAGTVKKEGRKRYMEVMKDTFEYPPCEAYFGYKLKLVPMIFDLEVGENWASLKEYDITTGDIKREKIAA